MSKPDQRIGALSTFLQQLDKLDTTGRPLRYFRGHSKQAFELSPSIFRNSGWIENEATMLKELILRCPGDFAGGLTTFQCLVKMQHYGLPTRLLDVTANPLVALYFACETPAQDDGDGEVMAFGFDVESVKYFDSDTVTVISNLSRTPPGFTVPVRKEIGQHGAGDAIEQFNEQESIKLLLHDIRSDKPHFLPRIRKEDLERVVCVKPLLDNPRIVRQEGAFLLFGCDGGRKEPAKLDPSTITGRFTIAREEKQNLREQLRRLGISRATMYPEIEHVAMHIKLSYAVPGVDVTTLGRVQSLVLDVFLDGGTQTLTGAAQRAGISSIAARFAIADLQQRGAVEPVGAGRSRQWKLVERLKRTGGSIKSQGTPEIEE